MLLDSDPKLGLGRLAAAAQRILYVLCLSDRAARRRCLAVQVVRINNRRGLLRRREKDKTNCLPHLQTRQRNRPEVRND